MHNATRIQYVEFLKTQCELYDDIGQIQRNLHTGLQDMVGNTFIDCHLILSIDVKRAGRLEWGTRWIWNRAMKVSSKMHIHCV